MTDTPVDPLKSVKSGDDLLSKIRTSLAGFVGYADRDQRREADRMLRESIASAYESQWGRISEVQRQLIASKRLELVDDLEAAAIKLRAFIDRIRHASYGYAGFFDHVHIDSKELAQIYDYDLALLQHADGLGRAIDNVEASLGSEGEAAAIRNLTTLCQEAVDAFDQRNDIILARGDEA
jgi:hypothetical protein